MSTVNDKSGGGLGSRRAWWIWGIAASAYLLALLHRMALGVAGTDAADRFDIPLGSLAIFTALQLVLYLVMQIPAGLLADRFGPRRTLAIGLALMATGELLFAFATSMPVGLAGRGLVGIGDALTFLNVLRLAHAWFPSRQQTLLVALTGFVGGFGQLAATLPLEATLHQLGWTGTFLLLGGVTAVLVVVPLVLVRDRPADVPRPTAASHEPIVPTLIAAWRRPGTRHGFFVHMGTLTPFLLAAAVWGVPFMEGTQGIARADAAGYLSIAAIGFLVSGPLLAFVARDHALRIRIASVAFPALNLLVWGVLLLWPGGTAPAGVLAAALALTGVAASGSMFAFEIARRESPPVASGSAAALVNCGGFSSAVVAALLIGVLINRIDAPAGSERMAVLTQQAMLPSLAVALIATIGCAWYARRPSVPYAETGPAAPVPAAPAGTEPAAAEA